MRLYCMCTGYFHLDESVFGLSGTARSDGPTAGFEIKVPSLAFLIVHHEGVVLFETGFDPGVATDPVYFLGALASSWKPIVNPDDTVVPQLARLGFEPSDIDFVVMSCLYLDHTGGMKYFPDSTFILQTEELMQAWWPPPALKAMVGDVYSMADIAPTRDFKFLELDGVDLDLFGDGSVGILCRPAHARREQCVVVRLPNTGTVLLPAGVIPRRRNFEENIMTGRLLVSPHEALRSVMQLKHLINSQKATVLYHHDLEDLRHYRLAPEYYD